MLVERAVQRDAVRLEEEVLQRVDALQPERLLDAVRQVRVVEDDVETERLGAESHCGADATCQEEEENEFPLSWHCIQCMPLKVLRARKKTLGECELGRGLGGGGERRQLVQLDTICHK